MSGLGETHWNWDEDVRGVVERVLNAFDGVTANTYVAHPFPGWDGRSVDFWGPNGRGHRINAFTGWRIVSFIRNLPGPPYIRHHIYNHDIWVRGVGWYDWEKSDHSGRLRHVHVTYLKP